MIIQYADLKDLRDKNMEQKIVFCSGSYDLVHIGHAFFLKEARSLGDLLVVSVGQDAEIKKNKGPDRPIMNENVRLEMIDSLKPVDYSFLTKRPARGVGWLGPIQEIFDLLLPDIYVVNSDAGDLRERRMIAKQYGTKMVVLGQDYISAGEKISTTHIINKIRSLEK